MDGRVEPTLLAKKSLTGVTQAKLKSTGRKSNDHNDKIILSKGAKIQSIESSISGSHR